MFRQLLIGAAFMAIAGCEASTKIDPGMGGSSRSNMTQQQQETAQLAAHAATAKYPANVNATRSDIAVLQRGETMRLINFSDQAIRNANVWINGAYVHPVDNIPPHGSVTVRRAEFYDNTGQSMGTINAATNSVTIQSGDTVYSTLGPVQE
jgi:hypothetical protein